MEKVGDPPEILWARSRKEITNQAFVELLAIEGRGEDPESGKRKFYAYRVYYLRYRIEEAFKRSKDHLYEKVCVEFEYCKKVKKHGKNVNLYLMMLDLGLLFFGVPTGAILAWALKRNLFERLCKCDKRK